MKTHDQYENELKHTKSSCAASRTASSTTRGSGTMKAGRSRRSAFSIVGASKKSLG